MGELVFLNFSSKREPAPAIGTNVQRCPRCGGPLSFSEDRPFCRNCPSGLTFGELQRALAEVKNDR